MIFHLARAADWDGARDGRYTGSTDDRRDGFIHFSTASQVRRSAERHRAGEAGLTLLMVAAADLGAALRWEPATNGDLYPHLYAPLDPALVREATPLRLGPDGRHVFPPSVGRLPDDEGGAES